MRIIKLFYLLSILSASFSTVFALRGTLLMTNSTSSFGTGDLFLYDLTTGKTDTLYKGNARGACFSPNGLKVAFSEDNKKLQIIDVFTKKIDTIGFVLSKSQVLWWANDNCIYFPPAWGKVLLKINVETRRIDTVYKLQCTYIPAQPTDNAGFFTGNVSADGKHGGYTIDNDQRGNRAVAIDFEAKTEVMMNGSGSTGHLSCQASVSPDGSRIAFANYNHTAGYIKPFQRNDSLLQMFYVPNMFMSQFSYNSNDDIVCRDVNEFSTYHYNMVTRKLTKLFRGPCAWTMDVRGWVLDTITPAAPTGLQAAAKDNSIKLSWSAPASGIMPTEFLIKRNGVEVGTTSSLEFADIDLTPVTAYQYSVYGRTNGVTLSAPLSGNFTTTADVTPPSIVSATAYKTTVDIVFSEPILASSVTTIANYTFSPSLSVTAAVKTGLKRVRLTTASTEALGNAILTVSGVKDLASNTMSGVADTVFVISGLTTSTGRACNLAAVDSGTLFWTDDDYPPASMGSRSKIYGDLPFLQTSINDGTVNADSTYLRFTLNKRKAVLIIGNAPWCTAANGWTLTGNEISGWAVSAKMFGPGQVTLKGRGGSKYSTYVVGFQDSVSAGLSTGITLSRAVSRQTLSLTPLPVRNGATQISFFLEHPGRTTLSVYDTRGRLVSRIFDGNLIAGKGSLTWNAHSTTHQPLSNGIYLCVLTHNGKRISAERFALIR